MTKLAHLLGQSDLSHNERVERLRMNVCGELTVAPPTDDRFSMRDAPFVREVAAALRLSSASEIQNVRRSLNPVLMCAAAGNGDTKTIKEMLQSGVSPNEGSCQLTNHNNARLGDQLS